MSDKISIFKMATTCGDVVTHLINSQRGVDLIRGVSTLENLIVQSMRINSINYLIHKLTI